MAETDEAAGSPAENSAGEPPPSAAAAARAQAARAAAEAAFGRPPPQTLLDVAAMLDLSPGRLRHALFDAPDARRYASFEIPKRTGGMRRIDSPLGIVRVGQDRLRPLLYALHRPHPTSHGFLPGRSILSNADGHAGQRLVLNVDLEDFFPTINFGRVRGLFRAAPFFMGDAAATVCAQLCTFRNGLPQGAPTSPILSNYIATGLDRRLNRLARANRCRYSRYADDITFSTNAPAFPVSICRPLGESRDAPVAVGTELAKEIAVAGFAPNPKKVRLQTAHVRQAVTGVTVNAAPNLPRKRVRKIRAMIHAWRKFGLEAAGRAHLKTRRIDAPRGPVDRLFRNALYGELAYLKMIRGENDVIFKKFAGQLLELDPNPPKSLRRLVFGADDFEVFISHASEDKQAVARPIFEACEALGIKAFLDQEHIDWGASFTERINIALGAARLVLAVVSNHSVSKDWPLREINTALGLEVDGEKTVATLMVGRPDLSKLPLLRQKSHLVWDGDAVAVARRLKTMLDRDDPGAEPDAPAPPAAASEAAASGAAASDAAAPGPAVRPTLIGRLFGRNR